MFFKKENFLKQVFLRYNHKKKILPGFYCQKLKQVFKNNFHTIRSDIKLNVGKKIFVLKLFVGYNFRPTEV